jgi:hypothetical protein
MTMSTLTVCTPFTTSSRGVGTRPALMENRRVVYPDDDMQLETGFEKVCRRALVFTFLLAACGEVRTMKSDGGGATGSACTGSSQCDSVAPYCVAEACASACTDDLQCPGAGQAANDIYCVDGSCGSCRNSATDCSGSTPVCDAGACRACSAHSECASDLCDVMTGACVAETAIVYATPAGSATSACTKSDPCTLVRAFAVVDATRNNVRLAAGTHVTPSTPTSSGLTIVLYGPADLNGGFDIKGGTTLRLRSLRFAPSTGIFASPAVAFGPVPTVDLEDVTFGVDCQIGLHAAKLIARRISMRSTTSQQPIDAQSSGLSTDTRGSQLTIDQSTFDAPSYGIVLAGNSSAQITNSVFRNSVPSGVAYGLTITGTAGATTVSFSTFHNVQQACDNGTNELTGRNNIFVNDRPNAPVDTVTTTSKCQHFYSVMKPQTTAPNGANNILNADPRFADGVNGNYHLSSGSPAIDAADPTAILNVDFEGTVRPQGAGRDIGAFEYH